MSAGPRRPDLARNRGVRVARRSGVPPHPRPGAAAGGDRGVRAYLHVNTDEALAVAAEVDAIRAAGGPRPTPCTRWPACPWP